MNRRHALAAGTAALAAGLTARADAPAPLTVALIGCGGMGTHHLAALVRRTDVRVARVCDVDANRLAAAVKLVEAAGKDAPKPTKDLRDVLADKDIAAVFIATPDHWHTPAALLALEAGKHVYVEKPCSHNVREGRLLADAAKRTKRVVQVGTQSRSTAHVREAVQRLRDGAIGEVLACRVWNSQLRRDIGHTKPTRPPESLDFDLWLGPTPAVEYRPNLLPGVWRWWHDFGCGDMGNDGVHDIDIGRWGLGVEEHPVAVAALGGKYFFDDDQQFPDTQTVIFEFAASAGGRRKQLIFEQRIWSPYVQEGHENGNAFYGTKGMMVLGKGSGWQIFGLKNVPGESMKGSPDLSAHHTNFLECVREGKTPNADAETGHRSAVLCHLGNLATRFGRSLRFDPTTEKVVGDDEVNALMRRKYREHWATPRV